MEPLRILYSSKLILMATSLGISAIVVARVYCIYFVLLLPILSEQSIAVPHKLILVFTLRQCLHYPMFL